MTAAQALGWMLFWGVMAAFLNIALAVAQLWAAPRKPPERPIKISLWASWLFFWLMAAMLVGWRYLIQ